MTTLREAAQQAQQALEALAYIDSGYWHDFVEGPLAALRTALAEQESVRGEWQGYTWNPYAVSQPKAEPLTDEEIDNTTRKQVDDLLDHIYEYGTAAEGIDYRVRAIAHAIERAHGIGEHE